MLGNETQAVVERVLLASETGMPRRLVEWLASLSQVDADELWRWLDGTPNCEMEMEDAIADLFPSLNEDVVGENEGLAGLVEAISGMDAKAAELLERAKRMLAERRELSRQALAAHLSAGAESVAAKAEALASMPAGGGRASFGSGGEAGG